MFIVTTDDIRMILDRGDTVAFIVLDLSEAFDIVSHPILKRPLHEIGIEAPTRHCICSFLSDKTQAVSLAPYSSEA